jgi:hypothetical protein
LKETQEDKVDTAEKRRQLITLGTEKVHQKPKSILVATLTTFKPVSLVSKPPFIESPTEPLLVDPGTKPTIMISKIKSKMN